MIWSPGCSLEAVSNSGASVDDVAPVSKNRCTLSWSKDATLGRGFAVRRSPIVVSCSFSDLLAADQSPETASYSRAGVGFDAASAPSVT